MLYKLNKTNFIFKLKSKTILIHVKIITGFLGAGKTTFINHYMKSKPDTRFGIIENEFGKENIDSKLLVKTEMPVMEMTNGCICCSINEELYDALNYFYEKREEFDELIIEATGIADPASVAEPFLIHEGVKKAFVLDAVICLIDCENIEDRLADTKEAIQQIAFSNIILLNKTELVSDHYVVSLKEQLQRINSLAEIHIFDRTSDLVIPESSYTSDFKPAKLDNAEEKHSAIKSITIAIDQPFQIQELHFRLIQFMLFQAKDVYRMKAIVYDENDEPYILQSVGSRVSIDKIPMPELSTYVSKFVFIGKNLQREVFEKLLGKYVVRKNQD